MSKYKLSKDSKTLNHPKHGSFDLTEARSMIKDNEGCLCIGVEPGLLAFCGGDYLIAAGVMLICDESMGGGFEDADETED